MMNPNGYEYTWTDDRNWQKNRRSLDGTFCEGVFLNGNYHFDFSNEGVNPCSDMYPGPWLTMHCFALCNIIYVLGNCAIFIKK